MMKRIKPTRELLEQLVDWNPANYKKKALGVIEAYEALRDYSPEAYFTTHTHRGLPYIVIKSKEYAYKGITVPSEGGAPWRLFADTCFCHPEAAAASIIRQIDTYLNYVPPEWEHIRVVLKNLGLTAEPYEFYQRSIESVLISKIMQLYPSLF